MALGLAGRGTVCITGDYIFSCENTFGLKFVVVAAASDVGRG